MSEFPWVFDGHNDTLLAELRNRGFTDRDLRRVAHENWLRVFEGTLAA